MKDGKYPFILYNLGGILLNIVAGLIFIPVLIFSNGILHTFALIVLITEAIIILTNGVPIKNNEISNDGYNALHMGGMRRKMFGPTNLNSMTRFGSHCYNTFTVFALRVKK